MKKLSILPVLLICLYLQAYSQTQYEVLPDQKEGKILKGVISRDLLEKDTSFKWFAEGQKAYTPHELGVSAMKKYADSLELIVFMGTWCEDSHFVIPKMFFLLDKAGFAKDRVSLIGVDRDKKTISHLAEALNVRNVPTIIVMKNGKEAGRVVEYGPDGLFDKELGQIVYNMK